MSDNVIKFPKVSVANKPSLPRTEEELFKSISLNRMMLVDELIDTFLTDTASKLFFQGFPIENKDFFQEFVFVGELMRSMLYNSVDVEHPMYEILEKNKERLKDLTDSGDIVIMKDDENIFEDEED